MRTLSSSLFASVDGVVESPNLWQFDQFDGEMGQLMMTVLPRQDAVILGRRTYDEWSGYWPTAQGDPFGDWINPLPKYVASRTLTGPLSWQNAELIEGDLIEFAQRLKEGEGGEVNVAGSISVVRQLLFAGVLDTLTLMIHPVVAGTGKHLFEPTDDVTRLQLVNHVVTSKGNILATYALRA